MALGIYAADIVALWTGNSDTAARVAPLVTLLCIGSAINGLMFFPYSLQLAHGLSWIPLLINGLLLVLLAPLIVVLANRYGARGGAAAWAILEVLYLGLGTFVTHRAIRIGSGARWILRSVATPFLACAAVAVVLHPLIEQAPSASPLKIALVAASVLLAPLLCTLAFPSLRSSLIARLRTRGAAPHPA